MRKRIYEIIEVGTEKDRTSRFYDFFMIITIFVSIIPLAFKTQYALFNYVDKITVIIFMADYLLRFLTADFKIHKGWRSFFILPFTPMAIVDLIAILPSCIIINQGFKLFKIFRLFRSFRVFRVFKAARYSKSMQMILNIFKKSKEPLLTVLGIALAYVLISALIIINVEPQTFHNYFEAVYWATVSLTTMGYGDIYPVSVAGKIITMISSFFGIAIIALPASIITAGMMEEINKKQTEDICCDGATEQEENMDQFINSGR